MENKIKINLWSFIRKYQSNLHRYFSDLIQQHGEVFTVKTPLGRMHFFSSPTYIKHVLYDNMKGYDRLPILINVFNYVTGRGGIFHVKDYELWQHTRHNINPFFSRDAFKMDINVLSKNVTKQLDQWQEFSSSKKPMNLEKALSSIVVSNAFTSFFPGIDVDQQETERLIKEFTTIFASQVAACIKLYGIILTPLYNYRYKKFSRALQAIGNSIVDKCLASKENNWVKALAQNSSETQSIPLKEHLCATVLEILIGGIDTIDAALGWACVYMSLHPVHARRINEEAQKVVSNGSITPEAFSQLTYTRAVMEEILRLQPPVDSFARMAVQTDSIGEYKIEKGDLIMISPYHLHRLPKYWMNPEGFDPDRFSKPLDPQYKFIYLPFGAGPRKCIGEHFALIEGILVLAMINQRYHLSLTETPSLERSGNIVERLKDVNMFVSEV